MYPGIMQVSFLIFLKNIRCFSPGNTEIKEKSVKNPAESLFFPVEVLHYISDFITSERAE